MLLGLSEFNAVVDELSERVKLFIDFVGSFLWGYFATVRLLGMLLIRKLFLEATHILVFESVTISSVRLIRATASSRMSGFGIFSVNFTHF